MPRTKTEKPEHERHIVRNRSSRNGAQPLAVAIHSTESSDIPKGDDDLNGVWSWFDNPVSDASAHVGINDTGHSHLWVPSAEKAWTILQLNPVTVNIELVGRAAQPEAEWEDRQIAVCAKWIVYFCNKHNLPVQRGRVAVSGAGQPFIARKGVIRHSDLTEAGFGTHTDPGENFPLTKLIRKAQFYRDSGYFTERTRP
jgi:N-acetyl-anhydromuramyl-L-alanine amidase AmpD